MSLRIPESKLPLHDTVEQIDSIKDTSGFNRSPAADEHTRHESEQGSLSDATSRIMAVQNTPSVSNYKTF